MGTTATLYHWGIDTWVVSQQGEPEVRGFV
jgi:hypothetical protein